MQVLAQPLYIIDSLGFEENLIDVVVMRIILRKAQEQQEQRLLQREAISHFEFFDDPEEYDGWQNFRNAA